MNPLACLNRPPRILFTRSDRIGDLVLSTPVFKALREKYPEAFMACLTFCENREIIEGNPHLNEIILYDKEGSEKGWWGNFLFSRKLAKRKFDCVIHLHATNRMHGVAWLARIPVRIGWDRRCAGALTHSFSYVKKEGVKHEAEYNFDLLKPLEIALPENLDMHFPIPETARLSLEALLKQLEIPRDRPWVVVNPSASGEEKMWSIQKFSKLIYAVDKKQSLTWLAIGRDKDKRYVRELIEAAKAPIYDLSGLLNLSMLGALLHEAKMLISNDSGPVHIAQAVGTDVISIFVRQDPGLSSVRWKPLYGNAAVIEPSENDVEEAQRAFERFASQWSKASGVL